MIRYETAVVFKNYNDPDISAEEYVLSTRQDIANFRKKQRQIRLAGKSEIEVTKFIYN